MVEGLRVAIDVGGTFTDVVTIDESARKLLVLKVVSTPAAPQQGLIQAVNQLLSRNNLAPSSVARIVHVGTIGTNLLRGQLGMKIPKTALVTTRGFKDVIEIARQNRPELYNVFFQRPMPLVPRKLRLEVSEATDSEGNVMQRVNHEELEGIAGQLKREAVETVAISFINSFLNPENEREAKRSLSQHLETPLFTSAEIDPEHREYERTSTVVVNAVLAPVVSRYLASALRGLLGLGIDVPFEVVSSAGGLVDIEEVRQKPVVAVESGPAAGVMGAAELAKLLNLKRVISLDMGGTTAKTGSVVDYTPLLVPEMEVGGRVHLGRIVKGSGYPIRYPSVDLAEVSAGGGTIIWVDEAGSLRVGPVSAGAEPGPACYGAGGRDATITDANLVLGRLGENLLGGDVTLKKDLAIKALEDLATMAGMQREEAADAALKLVNLHMTSAVHIISLERGYDPRDFALVAFGGAGPMHAADLAQQIGVSTLIIPPLPGLFSALGLLMTDMKYNYVNGLLRPLHEIPEEQVEATFQSMTREALTKLRERGIEVSKPLIARSVDLRYQGQGYELEVLAPEPFNAERVTRTFEARHEAVYGFKHEGEKVELTALRTAITVPVRKPSPSSLTKEGKSMEAARRGEREVWFDGRWLTTPLYARDELPIGGKVDGPGIIEEYDSTVVLPPAWSCGKNEIGCLVLKRVNP